MVQQFDLGALLRIIIKLLKILFFGPNTARRLSWLRDASSAVLHLAGTFPEKFPYNTRREIEEKLRAANLCGEFDPIRESWKPKQDWEEIIKLALELLLKIVHDWSPKPEPPTPPIPPETDLGKYVHEWVTSNVKDPGVKMQAKDLADRILSTVEQINKLKTKMPASAARESMRRAVTPAVSGDHAEWLAFSAMVDAYLDDLATVKPGLSVDNLLDLWTAIASGLMEVAK